MPELFGVSLCFRKSVFGFDLVGTHRVSVGCHGGAVFEPAPPVDRAGRRRKTCTTPGRFILAHGDALDLNVHFHSLLLDGVYARGPGGALRFHPLPPPEDAEVERVVGQVARRITRLLERRGLGPEADPSEVDPLAADEPLLAQLYGASVVSRIVTGRRAGQRVLRVGDCIDPDDIPALEGERCASVSGVSLHANVAVPARDRRRLERLCRYVARPPVATERLSRMEDGRLLYQLKHRWRDGTTHVVFEPQELVEKLAALVPPPRFHLVRYHGILGPCASERDRVVPGAPEPHEPARPQPGNPPFASPAEPASNTERGRRRHELPDLCSPPAPSSPAGAPPTRTPCGPEEPPPKPDEPALRPRRLAWAELLRRVFAVDVLECPRCGGRMRLLAAIQPPDVTQAILGCLELPSRAPHPRPRPCPAPRGGWATSKRASEAASTSHPGLMPAGPANGRGALGDHPERKPDEPGAPRAA